MLDVEKVRKTYQDILEPRLLAMVNTLGVQADLDAKGMPLSKRLNHLFLMLEKLPQDDVEKLNRWIGFIQGALWAYGYTSINELRQHIISCTIEDQSQS